MARELRGDYSKMGREEFEVLKSGVMKRKTKRRLGLFIDATGLDRATRRLERKVDLSRLVSGLSSGVKHEIARYYCLIPYEDDARQFAFLDAVERAGIEVVTKRLPPKGVKRQVSMDVHIASDLIGFAYGQFADKPISSDNSNDGKFTKAEDKQQDAEGSSEVTKTSKASSKNIKRIATIVCPSREMSYALYNCHLLGVETSLADFGLYGQSDGWKGVDRWIDLSTSETIWRS